jgi:zinc transport system permease protein
VEQLFAPLAQPFMVHALLAGTIVGGLCALVGVFVVQRGLAFIGDGLAHAAFGGIALGLLLDVALDRAIWVALPFTVVVALGIGAVLRRGGLRGDVAVGVFFSVSLALGVLFLGLRPPDAPPVSVESVLFGSILAIGWNDLVVVSVVATITVAVLGATWTRLAYLTFDPELAALSGVPVAALEYLLLAVVAVVIVVSVETVGIALVSSFIVIPAATALMLGRTLTGVAALSVVLGVGGAAVGLLLSYHLDVASGATIILTLASFFAVGLLVRRR